jgi:hypothetical protein
VAKGGFMNITIKFHGPEDHQKFAVKYGTKPYDNSYHVAIRMIEFVLSPEGKSVRDMCAYSSGGFSITATIPEVDRYDTGEYVRVDSRILERHFFEIPEKERREYGHGTMFDRVIKEGESNGSDILVTHRLENGDLIVTRHSDMIWVPKSALDSKDRTFKIVRPTFDPCGFNGRDDPDGDGFHCPW